MTAPQALDTLTIPSHAETSAAEPRPAMQLARSPIARLLIATDGTPTSDAAVRIGLALAHRDQSEAELLTVFDGSEGSADALAPEPAAEFRSLALKRERWDQIHNQRQRVAPGAARWPVTFATGRPAHAIARVAAERQDELVVLGLGAHGAFERCLRRETALQVIRCSSVPVLAVAPHFAALPRSALVALDFSPSSMQAALAAQKLLGSTGTLYLAHVTPRVAGVAFSEPPEAEVPYDSGIRTLFGILERRLQPTDGVRLERVMLDGAPAQALLRFAQEHGVDLIAAGSRGYSGLTRTVLGSVSTSLLRGAQCSVLVMPPSRRSAILM